MTAEFEQLAQEQKRQGDLKGWQRTIDTIISLYTSGLMDIGQEGSLSKPELPPFRFKKPKNTPDYVHEIDALDLSGKTRRALVRGRKTSIKQVQDATDNQLLEVRLIGKKSLVEIRVALRMFGNRIISEREKQGIEDQTPVVLPYPSEPIM